MGHETMHWKTGALGKLLQKSRATINANCPDAGRDKCNGQCHHKCCAALSHAN